MTEVFKCRFCNFKTLKVRTTKEGKQTSGWPRLKHHIEEVHPAEAERMETLLGPSECEY